MNLPSVVKPMRDRLDVMSEKNNPASGTKNTDDETGDGSHNLGKESD